VKFHVTSAEAPSQMTSPAKTTIAKRLGFVSFGIGHSIQGG